MNVTAGTCLGSHQPKGTRFEQGGKQYMLVLTNDPVRELHGWILEFRFDRWFTVCKATENDIKQISAAVVRAHHYPERERKGKQR